MQLFSFGKQKKLHELTMQQLDNERMQLLKKELVPHHTKSFLIGKRNLAEAAKETIKDTIKELVCPVCNIVLHNRMFMREHLKLHTQKERYKEKVKDSEDHKMDSRVYL